MAPIQPNAGDPGPGGLASMLGEGEISADNLLALLRYPADLMRVFPVEQRVGNVKNNDPALLDPQVPAA